MKMTKLLMVVLLIPVLVFGQTEERPRYATGKGKKHRNVTDEMGQKQGVW